MRAVVVCVAGAALVFAAHATAAASTALTVTVWPRGTDGPKQTWTLRCGPVGGTLPRRADACRQLAAMARPFAPIPRDAVCTMVFGGPQVARVGGTFEGRRVWTTFRRRDGCEIARWDRHKFLLPVRVGVDASDGR